MIDQRIENLADILINYSVEIKKDNLVFINGTEPSIPLIKSVYKRVLDKGAHPEVQVNIEELNEIFYKNASRKQLKHISGARKYIIKNADIIIHIRGGLNTKALSNIPPKTISTHKKALRPLFKIQMQRSAKNLLQWTLTQFPTHSNAQESDMALSEYEDFVYDACFAQKKEPIREWNKLSKNQDKYIKMLQKKDTFHIEAPGTDLHIKTKGRKWINSDGKHNMPSGEVFTAPIEDSVNGMITYSFPAIYNSREVIGVKLEFKNGKVIKASAEKGEEFLKAMINVDKGAKYVGEFAFGLNYGIKKFTKNILFDEKIGGTMHMALGAAYPECGGKNESALHWDMILDLRKDGRVIANGELIFEKGKFHL
jgi:aminopeptidase